MQRSDYWRKRKRKNLRRRMGTSTSYGTKRASTLPPGRLTWTASTRSTIYTG